MTDQIEHAGENDVFLRGVLAAAATVRVLPSGDELCIFRVTVPRPAGERVRVDSIDCSTTRPAARRSVTRGEPGSPIEVRGRLRRRFWRTAMGTPASRYEVDVMSVRLPAAARRARVATPAGSSSSGRG